MQLMTEPKLDHGRHHHLETHQQQHYHHQIEPQGQQQQQQEQLSSLGAITNNNTASQQQPHMAHGAASSIHQSQLNQLISQQQQLSLNPTPAAATASASASAAPSSSSTPQPTTTYQQHQPQAPTLLQQHASRVQAHQIASGSPPMNNNITATANLAAPTAPAPPTTMNNIQPTSYTKNHLINNNGAMHLSQADELSIKKRREDLSRRPSYRKIFNDITGMSGPLDLPPPPLVVGHLPPPVAQSRQSPQLMVGQQQHQQQPPTSSPSPQALDLLNSVAVASQMHDQASGATSQSPVSVIDLQRTTPTQLAQQQQQQLQHSHHHQHPHLSANQLQQQQHQQHHHQHHQQQHQQQQQQQRLQQHHNHSLQHQQQTPQHHQHQIQHPLSTAGSPPLTGGVVTEEASKKRELRLQKNREAAKECRRKKKEYIKCLENRVAVLENQNKALIDELKTLKDLYCKSTNE